MTKTAILIIFLLSIFAVLLGYNYLYQPFNYPNSDVALVTDPSPTVEKQEELSEMEIILDQLTAEQRVSQLLAVPLDVNQFEADPNSYQEWLSINNPGFVTLFGEEINLSQVESIIASYPQATLPVWTAVDHEGGRVQRLSGQGFTKLPSWKQLCQQTASESAVLFKTQAEELSQAQVDVVFAPVVDLAAQNPVLKDRICSNDAALTLEKSSDLIKTYQQAGILTVIKHFPGIGQTTKDLHYNFDRVEVSPSQASLYRSLFSLFPQMGVMVSHVGVINQFSQIPCSLSSDCVGEIKNSFSQVLIFSDALDMKSALYSPDGDLPLFDVVMEAIEAGNNVLIFSSDISLNQLAEIRQALINRYQSDKYFQNRVDQSVSSIINYKLKYEK